MKTEIVNYLKDAFGLEESDVKDIYDSYISAFRSELDSMCGFLEQNNFAELKRSAHTVKGCALNCGDTPTSEIAIKLQELALAGNSEECARHIELLKKQFETLA